jgi:hypothetical protein
MWRRRWLLTGLAGAVSLASVGGASALGTSAPSVRPTAFGSCPALVSYAKRHLTQTHGLPEPPIPLASTPALAGSAAKGSVPLPGPVSASAASTGSGGGSSTPSYSTTNDQEAGVDEPDLAKTDGSTIFAIAQGRLQAVSVTGPAPKLVGSLDLGSGGYGAQLLLDGNRVLVISGQNRYLPLPVAGPIAAAPSYLRASPYYFYGAQTVLTEVDVSNPAAMAVTQTMTVQGSFVDARQSGTSARLVISSAPEAIAEPQMAGASTGWVPTWKFKNMRTGRAFTRPLEACSSIRRPVQFSGLGMLSIVTVNFTKGLQAAQSNSLMADAQIVYGSPTSLYVATQSWVNPELAVGSLPSQTTVIDRFDVTSPDNTTFVASGQVPGYLLNQFSLSEYDGYLRVASTSKPIWWGVGLTGSAAPLSQSYVTVLQTQGSSLVPVGQVSGLGQGEQIYSVRFVNDTGYVVTYHQVDPLYTIDLSTPTAPKVVGELDLEGYSAYLHPISPTLLLGVGVDVSTDTNEPTGSQVELFDVTNPASPKLVAKLSLGAGSSSQATYDHHAFLYWPPTGLAVLPVQSYPTITFVPGGGSTSSGQTFTGAVAFHVSGSGLGTPMQIVQDAVNGSTPAIERSIVVGNSLYTISDEGVMSSDLGTLARQAFVSFPAA